MIVYINYTNVGYAARFETSSKNYIGSSPQRALAWLIKMESDLNPITISRLVLDEKSNAEWNKQELIVKTV